MLFQEQQRARAQHFGRRLEAARQHTSSTCRDASAVYLQAHGSAAKPEYAASVPKQVMLLTLTSA
jgi:hypothetical protein